MWTRWVPDDDVAAITDELAAMCARMPADGIAVAKNFTRLVEEMTGLQGAEITENISHAFGSNLSFGSDEYNFVKVRSKVGTSKAFEYRDRYFDDGTPCPSCRSTRRRDDAVSGSLAEPADATAPDAPDFPPRKHVSRDLGLAYRFTGPDTSRVRNPGQPPHLPRRRHAPQ
ncbi:MAG: hypothetical protein U5R31_01645 [Acidimicrobiia bacterium]|nr:hypothetical protein [Acidimicrobiia bacterium]